MKPIDKLTGSDFFPDIIGMEQQSASREIACGGFAVIVVKTLVS